MNGSLMKSRKRCWEMRSAVLILDLVENGEGKGRVRDAGEGKVKYKDLSAACEAAHPGTNPCVERFFTATKSIILTRYAFWFQPL
jgi:hypothetical protein